MFFKRAHKQETTYQVWEEGNHPQIIESEAVMRQKLDYIHYNPVKRGYTANGHALRFLESPHPNPLPQGEGDKSRNPCPYRVYVDQPEHWRYSSARNYAGQEGVIEVIRAW